MAWYTRSRVSTDVPGRPTNQCAARRVAVVAAAGVVLTLAQVPASAAEGTSVSQQIANPVAGTPTTTSPEQVEIDAAAAQAKETGERVEVESAREANTTVYVEPSGNTTVEITEGPTRIQQDGEFVEIDSSLSKQNGVLSPEATKADVKITDGAGAEPLVEVSKGSKSLALDWPTDLPTATVDGDMATFDAGPAKDVRVTARNNGFSLHVILDSAPATAPVYRIPVITEGVRLVETDSGAFVANDAKGKTLFWIARPVAWDHTQDDLEAGPEVTVPVEAKLTEDANGGQILELHPSLEWLSDPARVYPVTIDPDTYTDGNADRTTFVMSSESYVGNPTSSMMRVGYENTYKITRSYIQHEIPKRPGTVISAKLKLYQYDARSCNPTKLSVYPVAEQWYANDHSSLTGPQAGVWWKTNDPDPNSPTKNHRQPVLNWDAAYSTSATFTHGMESCGGTAGPNGFDEVDVTKMVKAWDDGVLTNYGMALRTQTESDPNYYKAFCSTNINTTGTATSCNTTDREPKLIVTYNAPPEKVVDMATASPATSCVTGSTRPVITTLTPTLVASAPDPDILDGEEYARIHAEVWPVTGASPISQGDSDFVSQGTVAGWRIPAGALSTGASYKYRLKGDDGYELSPEWSDWCEFTVDTSLEPAYASAQKFLKALGEHLVGPSPTPTEGQLQVTPAGQAVFDSLASMRDAFRAEIALDGQSYTAVEPELGFDVGPVAGADSLSVNTEVAIYSTVTTSAGVETGQASETWQFDLRSANGSWMVNNAVKLSDPNAEEGPDTSIDVVSTMSFNDYPNDDTLIKELYDYYWPTAGKKVNLYVDTSISDLGRATNSRGDYLRRYLIDSMTAWNRLPRDQKRPILVMKTGADVDYDDSDPCYTYDGIDPVFDVGIIARYASVPFRPDAAGSTQPCLMKNSLGKMTAMVRGYILTIDKEAGGTSWHWDKGKSLPAKCDSNGKNCKTPMDLWSIVKHEMGHTDGWNYDKTASSNIEYKPTGNCAREVSSTKMTMCGDVKRGTIYARSLTQREKDIKNRFYSGSWRPSAPAQYPG